MNRQIFVLFLVFVAFFACSKEEEIQVSQQRYIIPGDTFFPEGIAYDGSKGVFYTGSVSNGDILKVDVQTGVSSFFAPGGSQGRLATTGMKLDSRGRLWVCGGSTNVIQVLNPDGSLLKSWDLSSFSPTGFINDCVLDNNYIYFTDSRNRQIYRTTVAPEQPGEMERWLTFTDQQIFYTTTGTNANGIVLTPGGKYLVIVVSSTGRLYRIDTGDKDIIQIRLNDLLLAGDGMLFDNNVLYVSVNASNGIRTVTFNNDYSQGTNGNSFGNDQNLLFNTTIAKAGNFLLAVNGQLNRRGGSIPPSLPFTVVRVTIP